MQTFTIVYASLFFSLIALSLFRIIWIAKKKSFFYQRGFELAMRGLSSAEICSLTEYKNLKNDEDKTSFSDGWREGYLFLHKEYE